MVTRFSVMTGRISRRTPGTEHRTMDMFLGTMGQEEGDVADGRRGDQEENGENNGEVDRGGGRTGGGMGDGKT
jgi:hypothetical protein